MRLTFLLLIGLLVASGAHSDMVKIELEPAQFLALQDAMSRFSKRTDSNEEQKKIVNYKIWIEARDAHLEVSFVPKTRDEDAESRGSGLSYAKGITFVYSSDGLFFKHEYLHK